METEIELIPLSGNSGTDLCTILPVISPSGKSEKPGKSGKSKLLSNTSSHSSGQFKNDQDVKGEREREREKQIDRERKQRQCEKIKREKKEKQRETERDRSE